MNLLSARTVALRLSVSRASLYRLLRDHGFPSPVRLGKGRNAWVEAEVDAWIAQRVEERG